MSQTTRKATGYETLRKMGKRLGLLRAIYLVSASCMGSFAFAFDTGVISALQSLVPIREEKKEKKRKKKKKKRKDNRPAN